LRWRSDETICPGLSRNRRTGSHLG
jgi:hypothetical protein